MSDLAVLPVNDGNDYKGWYEANPIDVRLQQSEGGAVMTYIEFAIQKRYNPETKTFVEWAPGTYGVKGSVCLVKKDGEVMKDNAEDLALALTWDGNVKTLQGDHWAGKVCQIYIDKETYKERTEYKAKRIKYQGAPIGAARLEGDALDAICNNFGSLLTNYAAAAGVTASVPAPAPATTATTPANIDPPKADEIAF